MLCLRTRYFTSFCQRMLLYEVTTFLKHRRSWNWGCRRHKSWICCTWGRHLRNDRGKQNCRSLVVADHERKSQTSKQEDTVSMWSNLHHFLKKWQQYLTLQKVLVIMTVHPVYLFEDKTIWRLYKTMLCFAFAALHIALLPNHWRSFPIKSYQVISWTRTGGSPCQMRRFGQVITTTTGPNLNDQGYQRRTKEEPSKDQEMKSKISGQHTVSTIPLKPISPYVLMNVLMADSKLQQNMISRSGPGRNLPNGEWHCEPCMSYQLPARCILSISEYLFSLPNISMANQKLQNRRWAERTRSWRSPWRNMCLLLAAGQSTALSFSQVLKNIEEIPSSQVKFEFAKFHLWGHGPRVAMCSWFQVLPQARHVWNCVDHWST